MAPKGFIYICVYVSGGWDKAKFENARLIPGNTGERTESECAKYLIDQINDRYKLRIPYPEAPEKPNHK